jgi:hypothetical protein
MSLYFDDDLDMDQTDHTGISKLYSNMYTSHRSIYLFIYLIIYL